MTAKPSQVKKLENLKIKTKVKGPKILPEFRTLDHELSRELSPAKPSENTKNRSDFILNKLMAGGPGPAGKLISDLEQNKKWEYKNSKAGIIGNKTKEFEKDHQYFANLLHLN